MNVPTTLQETTLYRRLVELTIEPELYQSEIESRRRALTLVDELCREADTIMGQVPTNFPEYTLHDATHLRRVAHLMGVVLEVSGALSNLTYVEVTVLLLAAHLHDIGMALPRDQVDAILRSEDFIQFRASRREDLHGLKELESEIAARQSDNAELPLLRRRALEVDQGILTEYLRVRHGELGAQYLLQRWGSDPRWEVEGVHLAETVAWICRGHAFAPVQLTDTYAERYPTERLIGQSRINPLYCTLILRLADILDFDRERTPAILYENISPRNPVSLEEWNKHLSVTGWQISTERIVFEAECTHPVYEKALRRFLDYIDAELQAAQSIVRAFPRFGGIAEQYPLFLPIRVERERIRAKNRAYHYLDLSFTLAPEQIVKLLMGRHFWGGTALVVRELIQNAYDAIRHRRALERAAGNDWTRGQIVLEQRLGEAGRVELTCRDNGIGMDLYILENFFFTVGRSYYRSPDFERERTGLRGLGVDFDPISQFGLGVASAFMFGNQLRVQTQRYLGPHRGCATALEVEVDGFSRMAIVREHPGVTPQPGTEITILGKVLTEAEASDPWLDPLFLKDAVRYLAAALDVPIEVVVQPPFPKVHSVIGPVTRPLCMPTSFVDKLPAGAAITLERDFAEFHVDAEGRVRIDFLTGPDGRIAIANGYARWDRLLTSGRKEFRLIKVADEQRVVEDYFTPAMLAQDGVTVAEHGWRSADMAFYGTCYPPPRFRFPGSYFLNLTGAAKLPLKPNRGPYHPDPMYSSAEERRWWEFVRDLEEFVSGVLEILLCDEGLRPAATDWWMLVEAYGLNPSVLSKSTAFEHLPVPVSSPDGSLSWRTLASLRAEGVTDLIVGGTTRTPVMSQKQSAMLLTDGIALPWGVDRLQKTLHRLVRATCRVRIDAGGARYRLDPLSTPFSSLAKTAVWMSGFDRREFAAYEPKFTRYLAVAHPVGGMNIEHPVAELLTGPRDDLEHRTPVDWLVSGLRLLACDLLQEQDLHAPPASWGKETRRHLAEIARNWRKVDWSVIPEAFRPPYLLLLADGSELAVTPGVIEDLCALVGTSVLTAE